jgi:hypothetical protein
LDFGANKLTNIAAPAANTDASTKKYVDDAISNLVNGAGPALDTLNELATALGNDAGFASTVTSALSNKQPIDGDLTAISAIADSSIGWLKKTSSNNWAVSTTIPYTDLSGAPAVPPAQTGNSGKYLTTNGTTLSWGTITAYSLPTSTASVLGGVKVGTRLSINSVTGVLSADPVTSIYASSAIISNGETAFLEFPEVASGGNNPGDVVTLENSFGRIDIRTGLLTGDYSRGATPVYSTWSFQDNGNLILPTGGTVTNSNGASVVFGPSSATDNAITRFDSTTGKLLQNSLVTISDTGDIDIPSGRANVTGTASTVGGGATVGVRSILAIDSAFGSNDVNDPASAQAIRGRVTGSNLTKTRNYIAGVTGQYLVTGTNASEFINTGLLGVVGNQTTTADAAVVAYLDGDGGLTTAGSAYGVSMKNSTPGSGFDYGLDLQFINLNVAGTTAPFKQADIRFNNGVTLVANTAGNISINGNILTSAEVVANGVVQSGTGLTTGGYLSVDGNTDLHNTTITGNLSVTGNISSAGLIWTISASGTSDYVFSGPGIVAGNTNDPVLYLYRGFTYTFVNTTTTSHPFAIRVSNGGSDYTVGVTGSQTGTQTFIVPMNAPSTLYYQCTIHSGMGNTINIV